MTESDYNAMILGTTGITHYYKLNETSGTTALDSGPAGNSLTYSATGITLDQGGIPGAGGLAPLFDGASGMLINDRNTDMFSASQAVWTIECWFKTNSLTAQYQLILATGAADGTHGGVGFAMYFNHPSYPGQLAFSEPNGGPGTTGIHVTTTGWHHLVIASTARNGLTNTLTVWLDGVSTATTWWNQESYVVFAIGGTGDSANYGHMQGYFSGNICKTAIYSVALTDTQVQAHYAGGTANDWTVSATTSFSVTTAGSLLYESPIREYLFLDTVGSTTAADSSVSHKPLALNPPWSMTGGVWPGAVNPTFGGAGPSGGLGAVQFPGTGGEGMAGLRDAAITSEWASNFLTGGRIDFWYRLDQVHEPSWGTSSTVGGYSCLGNIWSDEVLSIGDPNGDKASDGRALPFLLVSVGSCFDSSGNMTTQLAANNLNLGAVDDLAWHHYIVSWTKSPFFCTGYRDGVLVSQSILPWPTVNQIAKLRLAGDDYSASGCCFGGGYTGAASTVRTINVPAGVLSGVPAGAAVPVVVKNGPAAGTMSDLSIYTYPGLFLGVPKLLSATTTITIHTTAVGLDAKIYLVSAASNLALTTPATDIVGHTCFVAASTAVALGASNGTGTVPQVYALFASSAFLLAGGAAAVDHQPTQYVVHGTSALVLTGSFTSTWAKVYQLSASTALAFSVIGYSPSSYLVSASSRVFISGTGTGYNGSIFVSAETDFAFTDANSFTCPGPRYVAAASGLALTGNPVLHPCLLLYVGAATSLAMSGTAAEAAWRLLYVNAASSLSLPGGAVAGAARLLYPTAVTNVNLSTTSTFTRLAILNVSATTNAVLGSYASEVGWFTPTATSGFALSASGRSSRNIFASAVTSLGLQPGSGTGNLKATAAMNSVLFVTTAGANLGSTEAASTIALVDLAQAVVVLPWRRATLTLRDGGNLPHS